MLYLTRTRNVLTWLLLLCLLVSTGRKLSTFVRRSRMYAALCDKFFHAWIQRDHVFVPAIDNRFEYRGRWLFDRAREQWLASFDGTTPAQQEITNLTRPGSSVTFHICNGSSIFLALPRNLLQKDPTELSALYDSHHFALELDSRPNTPVGLVSVAIFLDGYPFVYHQDVHSTLEVVIPNPSEEHRIDVVKTGTREQDGLVRFLGIWIDRNAKLMDTYDGIHTSRHAEIEIGIHDSNVAANNWRDSSVEMYTSIFGYFSLDHQSYGGPQMIPSHAVHNLSKIQTAPLKISPAFVPPFSCLTARCGTRENNPYRSEERPTTVTAADLYFRNGLPGSPLFPLSRSHIQTSQKLAVVLELGIWDFLTFTFDPESTGERVFERFRLQFVSAFVNFVLTIRRSLRHNGQAEGDGAGDESYTYVSAPSTIPILLLSPLLPEGWNVMLTHDLHHALREVVQGLRKEGDSRTHLIDTAGWLEDEDFTLVNFTIPRRDDNYVYQFGQRHTKPSSTSSEAQKSSSSSRSHPPAPVSIQIPIPHPQAWQKVSSYLWLHLCPYVPLSPLHPHPHPPFQSIHCPFNRHEEYAGGEVYIPAKAAIGKWLEERKIDIIKEKVFG